MADSIAPLKRMATVKVITLLWEQRDIQQSILEMYRKFPGGNSAMVMYHEWQLIQKKVERNLSQLPLPTVCMRLINKYLVIYQREVSDWLWLQNCWDFSSNVEEDIEICLKNIFWTGHGSIDRNKTTVRLLSVNTCVLRKYQLACLSCMEDKVGGLYQQLSVTLRDEILLSTPSLYEYHPCTVLQFWACRVTGNYQIFNNQSVEEIYISILKCLVSGMFQNLASIQYFWPKLREEEKVKHILHFASLAAMNRHRDTVCYFLSQMNETQIEEYFSHDSTVLLLLMWQNLLLPIAIDVCDYLRTGDFATLKTKMIWRANKMHFNLEDVDHEKTWIQMFYNCECDHSSSTYGCLLYTDGIFNNLEEWICFVNMVELKAKWPEVETFFTWCLSDEEIRGFKREILDFIVCPLSFVFIRSLKSEESIKEVESLLRWYSYSEDIVKCFKKRISIFWSMNNRQYVQHMWEMPRCREGLKRLMEWCTSGCETEIKRFKSVSGLE